MILEDNVRCAMAHLCTCNSCLHKLESCSARVTHKNVLWLPCFYTKKIVYSYLKYLYLSDCKNFCSFFWGSVFTFLCCKVIFKANFFSQEKLSSKQREIIEVVSKRNCFMFNAWLCEKDLDWRPLKLISAPDFKTPSDDCLSLIRAATS